MVGPFASRNCASPLSLGPRTPFPPFGQFHADSYLTTNVFLTISLLAMTVIFLSPPLRYFTACLFFMGPVIAILFDLLLLLFL